MAPRLAGRRIVVTGSGGISSATVSRCVREGAAVHVITRDSESARELAATVPGITWSAADLSIDSDSRTAFDEAEVALGGLDGLVAVAGGSARRLGDGPIDRLSTDGLNATVALNLATTTNALREFTSRWLDRSGDSGVRDGPVQDSRVDSEWASRARDSGVQDGGGRDSEWASAVLIGSSLGRFPASPLFVTHGYAATKAAIEGLARSAAAHYSHDRLTVNVVAPGLTKTPMALRAQEDEVISAYARKRQPLTDDGFLDADDVADACEWMLGARRVTGQVIYVDGGWSVYGG